MSYFNRIPPLMALDLGTTKFCLAALRADRGTGLPQIETISVDADGMRRGMLAHLDRAQRALARLVEMAEGELASDIRRVVVGVAGSHLSGRVVTSQLKIGAQVVDPSILERLAKQASDEHALVGREYLHLIPLTYRLDGRSAIDEPLGFSGEHLTGRFFSIEADKHYLSDIVQLCNQTGLEVARFYAEPLASSSVIATGELKQYGLVTADIGGGTTDGIVYLAGKPAKTFTVNIGGKLMTSDLALGLGLSWEEAEKIKLNYGLGGSASEEVIDGRGLDASLRRVRLQQVHEILAARLRELVVLIYREIKEFQGQLQGGILLTGGGSEVKGIVEYVSSLLKSQVAKESPVVSVTNFPLVHPASAGDQRYLASKYATVVGLLHLELSHQLKSQNLKKSYFFDKYFQQFFNWLKELA